MRNLYCDSQKILASNTLYSFDREHLHTTYAHWQRGSIQKKEYSIRERGREGTGAANV